MTILYTPPLTLRLAALWCLLMLPLAVSAEKDHTLYLLAGLSRDFTIGKRVASKSGVYISPDRETVRHLGYHHPRMDKGDYDPRDPDVLYIAALNGVLGTRDGGESWKILTSWDMTEPKDVKVDPHNPDRVYTALPDGIGLSTDRGESWAYSDQGILKKYTQTLAPDRSQEGHVLAGTERGIYLTRDGGKTWDLVLPTRATVNLIEQSPHDPEVFLAATQEDGAWLTRDGGASWTYLESAGNEHSFHNGRFHPHKPGIMTLGGWNSGLLITRDSGKTWDKAPGLASEHVWTHAMDPDYPNRIYACLYKDTIYVSDDLGQTWDPFIFPAASAWDYLFVPKK